MALGFFKNELIHQSHIGTGELDQLIETGFWFFSSTVKSNDNAHVNLFFTTRAGLRLKPKVALCRWPNCRRSSNLCVTIDV